MNLLTNVTKGAKVVSNVIAMKSPTILTGFGVAGVVSTSILASKASIRAVDRIKDEEVAKGEALNLKETVGAIWKLYVPAAISGVMTASCIIGAHTIDTKRNAALASAYALSEKALAELEEQTKKELGEKKSEKIKSDISKEHFTKAEEKNPDQVVFNASEGKYPVLDDISGRIFISNQQTVEKACIKINDMLLREMFVSLNDFYYELGLDPISIGHDLGWNVETGLLEISYDYSSTKNGDPCMIMRYKVKSRYGDGYGDRFR